MRKRRRKKIFVTMDGRVPEMRAQTLSSGEVGSGYDEPVQLGYPGVPWPQEDIDRLNGVRVFFTGRPCRSITLYNDFGGGKH